LETALVKYKPKLPVEYVYAFKLVNEDIQLNTRAEIKQQLPDILGRALARSWVDDEYKQQLQDCVHTTLSKGGVNIPADYICEYETTNGQRAKIVVFEQKGRLKLRVCGLSLTMIATR